MLSKRSLLAALAAGFMVMGAGVATAETNTGPGGSSETDNEVTCGTEEEGTTDVGGVVAIGQEGSPEAQEGGVEVCSDDTNAAPVEGRAGVGGSVDDGGRAYVDGDDTNGADTPAAGWVAASVDAEGNVAYQCGDGENGSLDSQNPTAEDTAEDCG